MFQVPERNMADFVDAIVRITRVGDEEGEGTDGDRGAPSHAGRPSRPSSAEILWTFLIIYNLE
jgi:hypothetical protein